ncbi:MAG: hypothetical protein AAGA54_25970 [Myxococcota bacterium]
MTTESALYPREGHGLGERAQQLDDSQRFVRLSETYVAEPK